MRLINKLLYRILSVIIFLSLLISMQTSAEPTCQENFLENTFSGIEGIFPGGTGYSVIKDPQFLEFIRSRAEELGYKNPLFWESSPAYREGLLPEFESHFLFQERFSNELQDPYGKMTDRIRPRSEMSALETEIVEAIESWMRDKVFAQLEDAFLLTDDGTLQSNYVATHMGLHVRDKIEPNTTHFDVGTEFVFIFPLYGQTTDLFINNMENERDIVNPPKDSITIMAGKWRQERLKKRGLDGGKIQLHRVPGNKPGEGRANIVVRVHYRGGRI